MEATYEQFVNDPKSVIQNILDFLKLDSDAEACFQYLDSISVVNRNKEDREYFDEIKLQQIYSLFDS